MFNKKGQAAMEFLTTYGWAFLIIIVAVAGLSYFGVFSFGRYLPSACSLDGRLECGSAFAVIAGTSENSTIQFQVKNNHNVPINITKVEWIEKSVENTGDWCSTTDLALGDGGSIGRIPSNKFFDLTAKATANGISCGVNENLDQKKTILVKVTYNTQGSTIPVVSAGTITTTIQ